jgi:hypothetical protein
MVFQGQKTSILALLEAPEPVNVAMRLGLQNATTGGDLVAKPRILLARWKEMQQLPR